MAKLTILKEGEATLRKTCRPVTEITQRTKTLLDDMLETMRHADGVGLAAPQVGILRRVVVIDLGEEDGILELVNPVIIHTEGSVTDTEGCLSVPGKAGKVTRPQKATVRAFDRDGNEFEFTGEDLYARCICHECDHLDGILYVEKADSVFELSKEE